MPGDELPGVCVQVSGRDGIVSMKCPACGKHFVWSGRMDEAFPFCSKRCKMVDLAAWFNEEYRISMSLTGDDATIQGPHGEQQQ